MAPLKIVGFASGSPFSQVAMTALARDGHLAAVVIPRQPGGLLQRLRRAIRNPFHPLARLGAPFVDSSEVGELSPDVIVVASFPQIIPAKILASAKIGALNMHSSLLPRHRGVDPIFWTYWEDDREAGVTVHWMAQGVDTGDIAAQESVAFERGMASRDLYMRLALRGAGLLMRVIGDVASGNVVRIPQDEVRATYESAADITRARIPFAQWPAERVWHVLRGLGDQFSGLFADAAGKQISHGRATEFRLTGVVRPGHIEFTGTGCDLHCRDGIVSVDRRK
jgi:methionyl-tRNA formyltransferase